MQQFFQKHFRFYSRFSPISERVILFERKRVTEKEGGLWDMDKIKIGYTGRKSGTIIMDMRVIRKEGLYGRNTKNE